MKAKIIAIISIFLLFFQCRDINQDPYTKYKPVLMRRVEMEKVTFSSPRELKNVGKIYTFNNFLFISEKLIGVHIIDLSIPETPRNLGMLLIPGNEDIAIKNNIIYADSGPDLISINMDSPMQPLVLSRVKEIFSEKLPPDNGRIPDQYLKKNRPDETVIVSWE